MPRHIHIASCWMGWKTIASCWWIPRRHSRPARWNGRLVHPVGNKLHAHEETGRRAVLELGERMLLDIAKLPTAGNRLFAFTPAQRGVRVCPFGGTSCRSRAASVTREAIPAGTRSRYGHPGGRAGGALRPGHRAPSQMIEAGGTCIRTTSPSKNCNSTTSSGDGDARAQATKDAPPFWATSARTDGWERAIHRVMAASNCAAHTPSCRPEL